MPIVKMRLGKHDDILFADFGTGDVKMSQAKETESPNCNMILLHQSQPKPIGTLHHDWVNKTTDEIEPPDIVLRFKNIESLNALIDTLNELKETFND